VGLGVFLLVWDGTLKAAFCHRRLREKPPSGGVSVYRESIPLDKPLVEKCLTLLRELKWQGVAMVEFKIDQRDGQPKLMEVNGRFWGSLQLAIDAGINFPLMLYRLGCGEDVPAQFGYKVGVKSRWLLGDLDNLFCQLTHSTQSNGFSTRPASKFRACMDFLKFYEPNLHYEVWRLSDPNPGWFETKCYVRETLRSFRGSEKKVDFLHNSGAEAGEVV
jgi:biotin carboxylase